MCMFYLLLNNELKWETAFMGIKDNYERAKKDYYRLREICGHDIRDYCGAWCNNDVLTSMLDNPTKANAYKHFSSLIDQYYSDGFGDTDRNIVVGQFDLSNDEVSAIFERNGNI